MDQTLISMLMNGQRMPQQNMMGHPAFQPPQGGYQQPQQYQNQTPGFNSMTPMQVPGMFSQGNQVS